MTAFYRNISGTELKEILDGKKIDRLILAGLASSGCYGATVREAYRLGYQTIVASDAHADQIRGKADDLNNQLANYENLLIMKTEEIRFSKK
ncbi:MAG: isochorismatase family protein [Spirochaetales bacterium]|nr:isochorismatase family protein [Spirochaetales bacterium]